MDLNYLKNEVLPQRKKEIEEGLNAATRQPIYVVLNLQTNIIEGHTDYTPSVNYKGVDWQHGYADNALDSENMEFKESPIGMELPMEFTKFYTDRVVAFFLTRQGAEDYLKYQAHNLSDAYIYTFYSGYDNREMDAILCGG